MSPQAKDTLVNITGFSLSIALGIAVALSAVTYFRRFRLRGYRANIALLFVGGSCIAGIAIASFLVFWLSRILAARDGSPIESGDALWGFLWGLWFACFALCAVTFMHVLLQVLQGPKTRNVRGGWRKGWFYAAAAMGLIAILCLGAGLFSLIQDSRIPKPDREYGIPVIVILLAASYFGLGHWFLTRARASRQNNDVLGSDNRSPVLYLRSFKDETLNFDDMPGPAAHWWNSKSRYLRGKKKLPRVPHFGPMNFEHYIADAIERAMGPFIALGNPDDFFAPVGAAREYLGGPDWRKKFEDMVDKSTAVLALPGNSRELDWELGWLLTSGNAAKLFLLFGRWAFGYPLTPALKFLKNVISPEKLMPDIWPEPLLWSRYREGMNALGYTLPVDAPGASTVMGFSTMGHGTVIVRRCAAPVDYVNAIVKHLVKQAARQKRKRAYFVTQNSD